MISKTGSVFIWRYWLLILVAVGMDKERRGHHQGQKLADEELGITWVVNNMGPNCDK